MRCPDLVMSAMSYHPHYRYSRIAQTYWSFVADWQRDNGDLHRMGGQWYLLELASRFNFRSIRDILTKSIPLAVRRQRKDGGFHADYPAGSACQAVLAYSRHGLVNKFLNELPCDPIPLINSLKTPLGVKTRREVFEPLEDDNELSRQIVDQIACEQRRDGSWQGLIVATVQAIHDLLDCYVPPQNQAVCKACNWLLAQQQPLNPNIFPKAPPIPLAGMFYTKHPDEEVTFERSRHPEYWWKTKAVTCLELLPIFQTGAALGALCRCGLFDSNQVKKGFDDLLQIRGPGAYYVKKTGRLLHRNYQDHWCACNVSRWTRNNEVKFGT